MGIVVNNNSGSTIVDTETQDSLIVYLKDKLNDSDILPVVIGVSSLSEAETSACIVVEKTPVKVRQYVDGGYDGKMSVILLYRVVGSVTSDARLSNLVLLNKFNGYLAGLDTSDYTMVDIEGIEQSELSTLVSKYDNNIEDYGIKITLTYCKE